jgi:hypothetical protein
MKNLSINLTPPTGTDTNDELSDSSSMINNHHDNPDINDLHCQWQVDDTNQPPDQPSFEVFPVSLENHINHWQLIHPSELKAHAD